MTPEHRLQFHAWLIEHGLDRPTADAILMTMSPFDWHELATKKDLERFATKADFDGIRADLDGMRAEMGGLATKVEMQDLRVELRTEMREMRTEMAGIRTDLRTMTLSVVGFILAVLLAGAATAISLAV
ncbi:MAG: hypothetical protein AAF480_05225 [Actinomycetota bacterium]